MLSRLNDKCKWIEGEMKGINDLYLRRVNVLRVETQQLNKKAEILNTECNALNAENNALAARIWFYETCLESLNKHHQIVGSILDNLNGKRIAGCADASTSSDAKRMKL